MVPFRARSKDTSTPVNQLAAAHCTHFLALEASVLLTTELMSAARVANSPPIGAGRIADVKGDDPSGKRLIAVAGKRLPRIVPAGDQRGASNNAHDPTPVSTTNVRAAVLTP